MNISTNISKSLHTNHITINKINKPPTNELWSTINKLYNQSNQLSPTT